ncbi:MAG: RNA 3'-terminal phosphate cyclase [Myxococcales bacterium]|nr:RNA 3'-terminal phosphate cyclase [Myxococcales bacterium]
MSEEVHIDGSCGEGGGQILRTSLALAALRGQPLRISKIRAGRSKPGLRRQHLTCARAITELCDGTLQGDALGSSELFLTPGTVKAGDYHFSVGTAGSACLVFQTVLWPLLFAEGNSRVVFEGGTHNAFAPPFDFIERVFLPIVQRMGAKVSLHFERAGFMPAGGGRFVAEIEGGCALSPIEICETKPIVERRATALVANLPGTIAIRELREIRTILGWKNEECLPRVTQDDGGPGNVLLLEVAREDVSEIASVIGVRSLPAEDVAAVGAKAINAHIDADAPVGQCLADQLVIPFALAGGGRFRTSELSEHATTNIDVVKRFCDVEITSKVEPQGCTLAFSSP